MREDKHGDLVSTTAIVAGATVSIVVTVVSFMFSGDEAPPSAHTTAEWTAAEESPAISAVPDVAEVVEGPSLSAWVPVDWTDPRESDRGLTSEERRVIRAYQAIESMTTADSDAIRIGAAIDEIAVLSREYPSNPFIQEIHLKALRVSQYWAFEAEDMMRATSLAERFESAAATSVEHELTVREMMRMAVQRLGQTCDDMPSYEEALRDFVASYPTAATESILYSGQDVARGCLAGTGR